MSSLENTEFYNPIYRSIYDYEFLIPPISALIIGSINFGLPGAIIGLALGSIDIVANRYGLYNKPFLTAGMLGLGSTHVCKLPFYINDIAGFSFGILITSNRLNNYLEQIISPMIGIIYGYSYAGYYGAALGLFTGIIDEFLIYNDITNIRPLTFTLNNLATTSLIVPQFNRIIKYVLPVNLGIIKPIIINFIEFISHKKLLKESVTIFYSAYSLYYKIYNKNWV